MKCKIIKDKVSGEEFLIPGCMSVAHNWGCKDLTDREIIKTFCSCNPPKVEKYEIHTRDEVLVLLDKLDAKIQKHKNEIQEKENELDCIKSEVFMLNTVEVFDVKPKKELLCGRGAI